MIHKIALLSLTKVWKAPSSCLCKKILRTQYWCFRRPWSWRRWRFSTDKRNTFARSRSPSSMFSMLFWHVFDCNCACLFHISADRNVWPRSALRFLRLYGKVRFCDRRRLLAICDLRSSAITWKPGLSDLKTDRENTAIVALAQLLYNHLTIALVLCGWRITSLGLPRKMCPLALLDWEILNRKIKT